MSVTNTSSKIIYSGDGATSTFSFPFNVYLSADLVLTEVVVATGVQTVLAITTDYTVSLSHAAPTPGTITLVAGALASGTQLVIQRVLPMTQQIVISDYSPTPAATWEEGLDRDRMVDQQIQEQISRAILQPVNTLVANVQLPDPVAGKAIGWNDAGTQLTNSPSEVAGAATAAAAAAVSASAASASASAASGSASAAAASAAGVANMVKGDGTVNPTNLITNGDFSSWSAGASSAPDGWTLNGSGASVAREGTIVKLGSYSAKITRAGNDSSISLNNMHTTRGISYWQGRTVTLSCWVYATVANRAMIILYDGVGQTASAYHTGDSTWQLLTVTRTISASATTFDVYFKLYTGDTSAYFDGAMCVEGSSSFAFSQKPMTEYGQVGLGAWVDKTSSYAAQQAATDGFVCVLATGSGTNDYVLGYTDAATDPTGERMDIGGFYNGWSSSGMFPVKKGDYWKVVLHASASVGKVYWIPLGS